MANGYTRTFTLSDLFSNKELRNVLPQIKYKEKELDDGKIQYRTIINNVNQRIESIVNTSAREHYENHILLKANNQITIQGTLKTDINSAYNSIYSSLLNKKIELEYLVNNINKIRSALVEGKQQKRLTGIEPKLKLKSRTINRIKLMNEQEKMKLLNDIMENIFYNDAFSKTQEKYKLDKQYNYVNRKANWERKVGL